MSSAAVKRACDACHRRKVKCDGVSPCRNCATAQLSCTYNAVPQKKGPKGSRAKVISELRETQRQTSLYARIQNRVSGLTHGPSQNPVTAGPSPGMVTAELVKECSEFFFAHMYEGMPILCRQKLDQQAVFMEQSRDAYCLISALCALVMLQPGMNMPASDPYNLDMMACSNMVASQLLLEEAMRVRVGYEYFSAPTLNSITTSYLFFACYHASELHDRAWFYLREASTMMHMAGMHKEETYMEWDAVEASRRRRLYWLVLATERAYAIQRQRPTTLQASINLPSMADDPTDPGAHQLAPFLALVSAFRHFDDALIASWNKTSAQFTPAYTKGLDKQLGEAVPTYLCRDAQFNDLGLAQQWLRNTHWQLTSQGEDGLAFPLPAEMARNMLMGWAAHFPGQGVHLVGSGLIERLFEVANDVAAALSHRPASRAPYTLGPRERLDQMLNVVGALRGGDERFMPLLFHMVSEALPRLVSPLLQNAPEAVAANLAGIDLFDGFGSAGMAQPPPPAAAAQMGGFGIEEEGGFGEYERKYSPESSGNSSGHGGSGVQGTSPEMGPPSFTTSPGMVSPGVEFQGPGGGMEFGGFSEVMMGRMQVSMPGQGVGQHVQGAAAGQCQSPAGLGVSTQGLANRPPQGMGQPGMGGGQQQAMGGQAMMGRKGAAGPVHGMHVGAGGNMAAQLQRSGSFVGQGVRTVGDFHALQRNFP